MKKFKFYLETSVINFVFADDSPIRQKQTIELINMLKGDTRNYKGFISSVVIDEIKRAPQEIRDKLLAVINENEFELLEHNSNAKDLADEYIKAGLVPAKYKDDAYHIALATVYNMHAIISWNFKHIVKMKVIEGVEGVNILNGYNRIKIYSPLEVIENVEE